MGVSVEQWRAVTGRWAAGVATSGARSGGNVNHDIQDGGIGGQLFWLAVLAVLLVIGGVELNPGPTINEVNPDEQKQASPIPSSPSATSSGGRARHDNMAGSSCPKNITGQHGRKQLSKEHHVTGAACANSPGEYEVSGAKLNMHGTVYHLNLLKMFALRALKLDCEFQLGTEVKEAGQFDDIVLQFPNKERKTLYVQVKHKATLYKRLKSKDLLSKSKNAEFSVLKYFKSFVKINQAKGPKSSEIDFAICTNTGFKFDELCKLTGGTITLTLKVVTDVYPEFFKEGKCYKLVTDDKTVELLRKYFVAEYKAELSLKNGKYKESVDTNINDVENKPEGLKTEGKEETNKSTEEESVLKDDAPPFEVETKNDYVENKPEGLKTEGKEETNIIELALSALEDRKSLKTFLTNLTFIVEQPADNETVKPDFEDYVELFKLDINMLSDAFGSEIFHWFRDKRGWYLKKESIEIMIESIKNRVNSSTSSWLTRVYAENLLTSPLTFNEGALQILKDLMLEYRFVNLATSMESKLTLIQVAQAIRQSDSYKVLDSYMFMRVRSLLPCGDEDLTVDAFKSPGKHDLLVIDCLSKTEQVSERELTQLGNKLLEITTNNPQKKLVFIAPENNALTEVFSSSSSEYVSRTITNTWKDLTIETQDNLLAKQVDFQGLPVALNKVIDKSETELLEIVPLETLIGVEGLVIGTEQPSHIGNNESFYIDISVKTVNQIVLKANIFQDKTEGKFEEELAFTEANFQNLCKKHPVANIHWLEKQKDDKYVWVKSQGEFKALRPYIDHTNCKSCSGEEFLSSVKPQRVVIISDLAGMGKSTILTNFAKTIKAKCEGTFVFRIDLNNYTELWNYHKSTIFDKSSALELLCKKIIMIKTPLEEALFKRKDKVVLMFDGFDEVSENYEETVLGLIQNLTEATEAQIWVTTRPFMKEKLEDKLCQWSSSLEPFSETNPVDYLIEYWKHVKNIKVSDEIIQVNASSLVSQFSESISDKKREFTGIPLQMKMLAECFVDNCEKPIDLGKCFNLVDLYKKFINKKFKIYLSEKTKIDYSKDGTESIHTTMYDEYIKQHRYLALSVILSKEKLALLPDYKKKMKSDQKNNNMINKIGIVNLSNSTPHFIHRTFAEYCVAEYFMKLLKDPKCMSTDVKFFILTELLIKSNYAVVRSFLNGLLVPGSLNEFKTLITSDDLNNKNNGINEIFDRTAIEGNNNIFLFLLNGVDGKDDRVLKLLQDDAPRERLLYLAVRNNNYTFIDTLLQWTCDNPGLGQEIVKQMLLACGGDGMTSLHLASEEGHNAVVQTLLQYARDILPGGDERVKQMLEARDKHDMTSLHLASERGHNDVVQSLLQYARDILPGGEERVKQMLEARDMLGRTSLQLASWGGRNDVVQSLLQYARAILPGGDETVKRMLEACDEDGKTLLHLASERGQNDVVQTLLQYARDKLPGGKERVKQMLEARDKDGRTSLHWASWRGHNDVVQSLLQYARAILPGGEERVKQMFEARDKDGKTSLHLASRGGHNDVVQTLQEWSRDN